MGQRFAPRAFGSKKCVVLAFVVRPFIHSFIHLTSHFAFIHPFIHLTSHFATSHVLNSRPLKPQETRVSLIENALSLRARAGPLGNFRALLYYCNPELRVLSSA